MNLPKSLFESSNAAMRGSINNFGAATEAYLEAGFNYSFPLLNDRLYIGVRGKFLAGLARAQVNPTTVSTSRSAKTAGPWSRRVRST